MRLERALLGTTIVSMGLIAGFFYAYACSVMLGLRLTSDVVFIESMQSINATVRNAWFAPSFFGSLALAIATAVVVLARRQSNRWWVVSAACLYAAAFVVTMTINVPMNENLALAGPATQIPNPAAVRAEYENPWITWNIVRTVLSTGAVAALACAALISGVRGDRRREVTTGATAAGS